MSTYEDRLNALREQLKRDRLDGFVVPLTDEHMSEYVGAYAQRLAWLTGFQGSAGSAVVLPEEAAIFVDGRYTLQVREQVDAKHWQYVGVPQSSVADWLREHTSGGARIGYDRSEEHTSELQTLIRISYAVFCLKKKKSIIGINNQYYQVCLRLNDRKQDNAE